MILREHGYAGGAGLAKPLAKGGIPDQPVQRRRQGFRAARPVDHQAVDVVRL